jgi:hypothetical protein
MEFKSLCVHALRDKDPKQFRELMRTGQIDEHLQQKTSEAHELLNELLANEPKAVDGLPMDLNALHIAEEIVRAEMLGFPPSDAESEGSDE